MKYAIEMGLVAMIYIQSFIKMVQEFKVDGGIHRHTTQDGDCIRRLPFSSK
jgi:hypothetical protein